MNWFNPDYLLAGNDRQQAAYHALAKLGIFEHLAAYSPVLVGTIPIGIDIPNSDLDILLSAENLSALANKLEKRYSPKSSHYGEQNGAAYYLANLDAEGFEIEFFAQNKPTHLQNGYRHMLIEARLLGLAGAKAREAIHQLKLNGLKTEPAFAQYFGIEGNPYDALLELETCDDVKLGELFKLNES